MSGFKKRDQFAQIANFKLVVLGRSTVDELFLALSCASIAGPVPEIRSLKVQKYCNYEKTACDPSVIMSVNMAAALLFSLV